MGLRARGDESGRATGLLRGVARWGSANGRPCKPTPGTSAGDAYGTGGHYIYGGEARRGSVEHKPARLEHGRVFAGKYEPSRGMGGVGPAPPHARKQTRRVDAAETAGARRKPWNSTRDDIGCCEKKLESKRDSWGRTVIGLRNLHRLEIWFNPRFRREHPPDTKDLVEKSGIGCSSSSGGAINFGPPQNYWRCSFDPLGLRRIMFNFEEVQHAIVNPAWDKKAAPAEADYSEADSNQPEASTSRHAHNNISVLQDTLTALGPPSAVSLLEAFVVKVKSTFHLTSVGASWCLFESDLPYT
ncbi:hypothetical protein B0H14DRAFT_2581855 [Mycena olivaceomarginata]|nr:hypothetical protein B0H14DRAFT_2581855 [Mycena olivaceomarginata]